MATALITGIAGQDGSYLAELLLEKGYRVVGMKRRGVDEGLDLIAHVRSRVELLEADLLDPASLTAVIEQAQPDEVYNLAAQSSVAASWTDPVATADATGLGATRLLQAVRLVAPKARFFQAGSSEVFGAATESPQRETTPFAPRSPYGAAKAYACWVTRGYRDSLGLFAVSGILFNHESPRRGIEFVTRKVTDAVARIKLGQATELRMGNLDARRDWGFAGDYVRAMWMMLQYERPQDYVIGTGETHSVRELCQVAFAHAGLDSEQFIRVEPSLGRPADDAVLVADASRARRDLGWSPSVDFRAMIGMMVDADLRRLTHAGRPIE